MHKVHVKAALHRVLVASSLGLALMANANAQTSATCFFDTIRASTNTEQYFDNGDGTILDVLTGLTWSACLYGQTFNTDTQGCDGAPTPVANFSAAISAQESLNDSAYAGKQDWRLPNMKELSTLIEYACIEPAMRNDIFDSAPSVPVWSNTPNSQGVGPTEARVIHFADGTELVDDLATTSIYVRVVRTEIN